MSEKPTYKELEERIREFERTELNQKQMKEDLQLTQFSVDNYKDAVYWMGPDAKFIYVNNAAVADLGYSKEELLTMTVHDINPEFPANIWPAHWAELKEKKSFVIETIHQRKDGSIFPVDIAINLIQFGSREINCAIARNITERKQVEKALRESEERFALFMDYLPAIAFIKDRDGRTLYVNKHMNDVLGAKDWIGKTPIDLFPKDLAEAMVADDKKTLFERHRVIVETVPDKNGKNHIYQTHKFRINGSAQHPLLGGIALDITAQKEAEKALVVEKEKLQKALDNIKTLSGLIPICSSCKKIRDDQGYWNILESYIQKKSDAQFSHGMCPECSDKLYGDKNWYIKMKEDNKKQE